MARLDGKRALVTGASQGIGREVALRFAAEGARVAVNYLRHPAEAEAVAKHITASGGSAFTVQADVSRADQVEAMVQKLVQAWGGVDILVNNAGITSDNLVLRMSEEEWDRVVDTNLKGAFLCTKAALRHMVRQRWGRVLNMSSVVALTGNPGQANYTAAKAGLIGFTRTIAREVASRNITVNALAPGFITTQMVEQLSEQTQAAIKERIPLGRFGSPADVAALAAFLASEEAGYITGQSISVDGGLGL
jgi:3-oxoacyl-[acyl-carrier protein] reductase